MLTVLGKSTPSCMGLSRREVIQAGAGMLGLSLPRVLAAEELAKAVAAGGEAGGKTQGTTRRARSGRAKSILFLYLYGGPSQHETFDMKPEAPEGIRGPFRPIDSRTPGLRICEHLPKLAALSDQFSIIRTLHHTHNNHHACHWLKTGMPWHLPETIFNASEQDWPAMGSVVEYLDRHAPGGDRRVMPGYVYLPAPLGHLQGYDYPGQYAGWLGRAYNALATDFRRLDKKDNPYFRDVTDKEFNLQIQGLEMQPEMSLNRLDRRRRLVEQFDAQRRELGERRRVQSYGKMQERVYSLASSNKMRDALDIQKEPAQVRDRYGRHLFGQSCLVGRRMIEAGVRFVTVQWEAPDGCSWDSHIHSNDLKKYLMPSLDQTLSALLEDLRQRGLLEETLVALISEIGRTPHVTAQGGRGHWCHTFPALLAGGGIRGGATYGTTDAQAGYPTDRPVRPADLSATLFASLGIDPDLRIPDPQGRPVTITDHGRVLDELLV